MGKRAAPLAFTAWHSKHRLPSSKTLYSIICLLSEKTSALMSERSMSLVWSSEAWWWTTNSLNKRGKPRKTNFHRSANDIMSVTHWELTVVLSREMKEHFFVFLSDAHGGSYTFAFSCRVSNYTEINHTSDSRAPRLYVVKLKTAFPLLPFHIRINLCWTCHITGYRLSSHWKPMNSGCFIGANGCQCDRCKVRTQPRQSSEAESGTVGQSVKLSNHQPTQVSHGPSTVNSLSLNQISNRLIPHSITD